MEYKKYIKLKSKCPNLPCFELATLLSERTKVHNILVFIGGFGLYEPSESMVAAESSNFTDQEAVAFVWFLVHRTLINLNLKNEKNQCCQLHTIVRLSLDSSTDLALCTKKAVPFLFFFGCICRSIR